MSCRLISMLFYFSILILVRVFFYNSLIYILEILIGINVTFSGIKKYIVGLIIKTSSDPETMEREKVYLSKLNMILVQVRFQGFILSYHHSWDNPLLFCFYLFSLYFLSLSIVWLQTPKNLISYHFQCQENSCSLMRCHFIKKIYLTG